MRSGLSLSGRSPKRYLLLAFLIPFILVGLGWIALEVHPFGTRQILVTDFWHQYYPFLCIIQEKLKMGRLCCIPGSLAWGRILRHDGILYCESIESFNAARAGFHAARYCHLISID